MSTEEASTETSAAESYAPRQERWHAPGIFLAPSPCGCTMRVFTGPVSEHDPSTYGIVYIPGCPHGFSARAWELYIPLAPTHPRNLPELYSEFDTHPDVLSMRGKIADAMAALRELQRMEA